MRMVYQIFCWVYLCTAHVAAIFQSKARKWVVGRRNWQQQLQPGWNPRPQAPVLWMHCASLGEFEQGRPVLEALRKQVPELVVVLTFFSPSGYEVRKNYAGAERVLYLPFDGAKNAKQFLNAVQPNLVLFVKYEFWHYYLNELKARQIATLLVAGIFRPQQPFFQWWGAFHRQMLQCFQYFFVQDAASAALLESIGFKGNVLVAGDPRFDRVLATARSWQPDAVASMFVSNDPVLVAGSTWPKDEKLLAEWLSQTPQWKLILAPHEISARQLQITQQLFQNSILYSHALKNREACKQKQVLIIDRIGLLAGLYRYGSFCYVGGGFNKSGHHNILEAAVYEKAVVTGPVYQKFAESVALQSKGGSFAVHSAATLNALTQSVSLEIAGRKAGSYVMHHAGATDYITHWIQENRLLTKP